MVPFRLLEPFFDDILVDMIVVCTKLYSHREKADISFEIANEKFYLKQCYYLVGVISFQTVKRIGRRPPILPFKESLIQCLVIRLNVFLWNLHLCDNEQLDK